MTQIESAQNGVITPLMHKVARRERVPAKMLCDGIRRGTIVIPHNNTHTLRAPCAIGAGLSVKVNANLGTSTDEMARADEIEKLEVAVRCGADAVMDLSVGGDLARIRKEILKHCAVPLGTVPIYEIAVNAQKKSRRLLAFSAEDCFDVLERQAQEGVDFFTIHAGVTRSSLAALRSRKRVLGIVSRGGAILAGWIKSHKRENPFYEHFDRVLEIARRYDVTLSLGDGLRPGSILDATDPGQIAELKILGALALRARKAGVQVMIEGPGHVPLDQIEKNVLLEKKYCHGAPFYVLGPLVTDIAAGYDHITGAIGGAIAARAGADFLCYLTPSEHLRHPSVQDVREGVIASKIAAHAADIVKGVAGALGRDRAMSAARAKRDWKQQIRLCLDPEKAREYRASSKPRESSVCTMCGKFCSIKLMEEKAKAKNGVRIIYSKKPACRNK
ncbi:MAG TPA: phosphomethylpyrimidine synthase ThiC [Candidatus Omnitrophota bacterium]|nr:phosphomethylpyrimidine synthase ThiC [Candidatus Omnitrophota bacterium]HQO38190.1 phosphomethylpyrimidine synthase ThiC [Candidatus Omnitrophota bacterium]HQQ06347.1 phosphomethylpyrimidine synthase ThiC [Candidatus Omnitrophota bacterium]